LSFYLNRLLLDQVTAGRFSSIQDKKAGSEILQAFRAALDKYVDAVEKEEADALINSARLSYAVPLLARLANLVAIRDALPTAMGLWIRRFKARGTGFCIGGVAGAVLGAILAPGERAGGILAGAFLGMMFIGGCLVTFAEPRLHKLFMPKNWDHMVALADENGVNLGINAKREELDGIISQVESDLPAVSEQRDANPHKYKARYEAAIYFIQRTQTRFAIA
jgi:hypothetical protein